MAVPAAPVTAKRQPIPLPDLAWLTYQALDHSDDIVLLFEVGDPADVQGATIIAANGAFCRTAGFREGQLIGHPLLALLPNQRHAAAVDAAIRGGKGLRTEVDCLRADGATFVLGVHIMPAPEAPSGLPCFALLGRDVTETLEARRLQASIQQLLAKVFVSVDEAVAILDSAGRIVMTNPHIDRLLGYPPNGLVGRNSLDAVASRAHEQVASAREQQLASGCTLTYEVPLLRADGSEMAANVTSVVVDCDNQRRFRILTIRPGRSPAMREETAGHIKLVGLEEVRERLGARWSALAARAMATAEAVIKRRCGKADSFSRIDEVSFLICFGGLDAREASLRAALIGREIRDRLIGQDGDSVSAQVRSVAAHIRYPYHEGQQAADRYAALLEGLNGQLAQIEASARRSLAAALQHPACDPELARGRNPDQVLAMLISLSEKLERELFCALSALPRQETEAFDLDGLLLGLAAQQAIAGLGEARPHRLLLPVRFEVFHNRTSTERYLALCRKLDPRVSSQLIFLISDLPEGLPMSRLFECANWLRPYCLGVGFQADNPALLAPVDLAPSGHAVAALPASAAEAMTAERLHGLIASLHVKRIKLLVRRVAHAAHAAALLSQGVDMVSMLRERG